jgi:hypothetical protein
MRRISTFLLAGFALYTLCSVRNAHAADAVAVEPAYVTPGKPITLKWYFTGEGVVVTGKTSVTDTPRATTKYTFDVWYKVPAPKPVAPQVADPKAADPKGADPKGTDSKSTVPKAPMPSNGDSKPADTKAATSPSAPPAPASVQASDTKATDPKTGAQQPTDPKTPTPGTQDGKSDAAPQEMVLQHVQYTTYAEVWSGVYPPMKAYRDPHGWQMSCLSEWKHDGVPTPGEGSDGLNYFQVEDDSVERVAVAIMPCQNQTAEDVLSKISEDVYGHYQQAVLAPPVDLTFNGVPAKMLTFNGIDLSHPGVKTASVVLLFVRNGRAYVISARTGATHFNGRRPILEKVVRSFAFNK